MARCLKETYLLQILTCSRFFSKHLHGHSMLACCDLQWFNLRETFERKPAKKVSSRCANMHNSPCKSWALSPGPSNCIPVSSWCQAEPAAFANLWEASLVYPSERCAIYIQVCIIIYIYYILIYLYIIMFIQCIYIYIQLNIYIYVNKHQNIDLIYIYIDISYWYNYKYILIYHIDIIYIYILISHIDKI